MILELRALDAGNLDRNQNRIVPFTASSKYDDRSEVQRGDVGLLWLAVGF